jgi:hypothetical protein
MLDFLKELQKENFDALFFLPGDKKDQLHIEGALYKDPGESVGGNELGKEYHVILFKENVDGIYNVDQFDAIFTEPLEYMSTLIPDNWYGVFAKKTTTSESFMKKVFDKLQES